MDLVTVGNKRTRLLDRIDKKDRFRVLFRELSVAINLFFKCQSDFRINQRATLQTLMFIYKIPNRRARDCSSTIFISMLSFFDIYKDDSSDALSSWARMLSRETAILVSHGAVRRVASRRVGLSRGDVAPRSSVRFLSVDTVDSDPCRACRISRESVKRPVKRRPIDQQLSIVSRDLHECFKSVLRCVTRYYS